MRQRTLLVPDFLAGQEVRPNSLKAGVTQDVVEEKHMKIHVRVATGISQSQELGKRKQAETAEPGEPRRTNEGI